MSPPIVTALGNLMQCVSRNAHILFYSIIQLNSFDLKIFCYTEYGRYLTNVYEISQHTLKMSPLCEIQKSHFQQHNSSWTFAAKLDKFSEHEIEFIFTDEKLFTCGSPINLQNYLIHAAITTKKRDIRVRHLLCTHPITLSENA